MESVPLVPLERLKERISEQIVDFFVPRIKEATVGVVQTIPRECLLPRTEQIVETFVPPLLEEENCVDVMHLTAPERENRKQEPIVGVPVRHITEDGVEQIGAVPVPQIKGDIVEVPPCRVPQVMEEIMKVNQSVPFERIQKRVGEQIAAVPV